jgi:arsenite methyltransferase
MTPNAQLPVITPDSGRHPGAEQAVRDRYAAASRAVEPALCCAVEYPRSYLDVIPSEIIERDYGCGDPTAFARPGETVLDLGSGGGKVCYILAQVVGPNGRVIGVDCNDAMLELARRHQQTVAGRLGYANVEFRRGLIQDLSLDLDRLAESLARRPVGDTAAWLELRDTEDRLRREHPLVADASVDCVVSNCVLNLVRSQDRRQLFAEVFRVLRAGGRAAISDIVADADVPEHLRRDPTLWSGCISGAFREDAFLRAFEDAGFDGIQIVNRQADPWQVVEGVEFRSMTVLAFKPGPRCSLDRRQAAIYRGPFKQVTDDAGRGFVRGERMAIDEGTASRLRAEPYAHLFDVIEPHLAGAPGEPKRNHSKHSPAVNP